MESVCKLKSRSRQRACSYCRELFTPKRGVAGLYIKSKRHWVCGKCEEHFEYCSVCDDWSLAHWSSPCYHLFWNKYDGIWDGPGKFSEHPNMSRHKEVFLHFLGLVDRNSWRPMVTSLLDANLQVRTWGPLIGTLDFEACFAGYYNPRFIEHERIRTEKDEEAIYISTGILGSLDEKTMDINRMVAGWIGEKMLSLGRS